MRLAPIALLVLAAGCASGQGPDIGPLEATVPPAVTEATVVGTLPPVVSSVTEPRPSPGTTEPADEDEPDTTAPAVTEPIPGPASELDPENICPQDADEIAANEPPHPPPCEP